MVEKAKNATNMILNWSGQTTASGDIRSHRNSAAPLSNRDLIYISFLNAELLFYMAGLLYLLRFERVDNLGAYRIPPETGLLIPSVHNTH